MEQKKQTIRRSREETIPVETASGDGGSEALLPAVHGWAGVAREAYENCEKGEEAVKKVQLRRNKSGQ